MRWITLLFLIFSRSADTKPTIQQYIYQAYSQQIAWLWDGSLPPKNSTKLAIVTEHILLSGDRMLQRPRKNLPNIGLHTTVIPLVHVEFDIFKPPPVPTKFHDDILQAVLKASLQSTSGWVQLDYEARPSHRLFYKTLVHDIKAALPSNIKLSVTALAWWCSSKDWLDDLEADEVVPMFFRMGKSTMQMNNILSSHPEKFHPRCQATSNNAAIGFAVQEPPTGDVIQQYAKIYWFNYNRWNERSIWPPITQ